MTIQEAVKSGKPFKLPHHELFIFTKLVEGKSYFFQEVTNTAMGFFSVELIMSDKWEIKTYPDNVIKFDKKYKKSKLLGTA